MPQVEGAPDAEFWEKLSKEAWSRLLHPTLDHGWGSRGTSTEGPLLFGSEAEKDSFTQWFAFVRRLPQLA